MTCQNCHQTWTHLTLIKTLAENLTKKTCVILRTLPWGLDTLSWSHISSLDLTLLHLSSCSHFFFIAADWLLLKLHLHFFVLFQASINPIIAQPLLSASDVWHFVIRSALFCFVLMYARCVNFSTTSCTHMYFSITCFILPSPLLDAHAFADWLSTWFMRITSWPNSCKRCFVTVPSATPVVKAFYSASAELILAVCCILDHAVSVALHTAQLGHLCSCTL